MNPKISTLGRATPVVVRLPVRFDDAAVDAVRTRLTSLACDPSTSELVLDGSDVEEVTGRALGLLVALRHRASDHGIAFVLERASGTLSDAIVSRGLRARLLVGPPLPLDRHAAWGAGIAANA